MNILIVLLIAVFAAVVPAGVQAAQSSARGAAPGALPVDAYVKALAQSARQELPYARKPDGTFVGEETKEDLARPVIPFNDQRLTVAKGAITAYAALCGLDWREKSYVPFMKSQVESKKWSQKQLAYINILHNLSKKTYGKTIEGKPCPPNTRDIIRMYIYR